MNRLHRVPAELAEAEAAWLGPVDDVAGGAAQGEQEIQRRLPEHGREALFRHIRVFV